MYQSFDGRNYFIIFQIPGIPQQCTLDYIVSIIGKLGKILSKRNESFPLLYCYCNVFSMNRKTESFIKLCLNLLQKTSCIKRDYQRPWLPQTSVRLRAAQEYLDINTTFLLATLIAQLRTQNKSRQKQNKATNLLQPKATTFSADLNTKVNHNRNKDKTNIGI